MSAFKKFKSNEVAVSLYNAQKFWTASLGDSELNVSEDYGLSSSFEIYPSESFYSFKTNYRSLEHLYYRTNISESLSTSSYDSYEYPIHEGSRKLDSLIKYISIPRSKVGTHIVPGSVSIKFVTASEYILVEHDYVEETPLIGHYVKDI